LPVSGGGVRVRADACAGGRGRCGGGDDALLPTNDDDDAAVNEE